MYRIYAYHIIQQSAPAVVLWQSATASGTVIQNVAADLRLALSLAVEQHK